MGVPQDWESAAVYLHRGARSQRRSLRASFTEGTIPTSGVPESPQSNYIITMRLKVSVSECTVATQPLGVIRAYCGGCGATQPNRRVEGETLFMARRRLEEGVVIARVQGEVDLQGDDHSRCKMSVVYFASFLVSWIVTCEVE